MSLVKKSSGIIIGLVILLAISVSSAHAVEDTELQWANGVSGKLLRGEVFTYREYSVEAIAFPAPVESDRYKDIPAEPVEPFVGVNISKNGNFIRTVVLGLEESYILPDKEMKITAKQLPSKNAKEWLFESYAPWATIELSPRGTPSLEVVIETEEDKYVSSSATEIVTTIQMENTGSADAINVDLSVETELQIRRGELKNHYDRVRKGEVISETLTFSAPSVLEQKGYGISVNVSGYDVKGLSYAAKDRKTVTITVEPEKGLIIRKSVNNKIYLKDYAMVSLSVKNNGKEDVQNVSITDFLPGGFKLVGNRTLHWMADIPAGGEWEYRYLVKPTEANKDGVVFPSATAEFRLKKELYGIRSNQPKVRVNGPKIVLTKQTNISELEANETAPVLAITITAENKGNTPTKVFINDVLPPNASVLNGSTTREEFLEASRKVSFGYSIVIESGPPIRLPPVTARYFELGTMGGEINISGTELVIGVKATPEINDSEVPEPTPEPVVNVTVPAINESLSNSAGSSNATSLNKSIKIDSILNFIFGCDKNSSSSGFSVCNLLRPKNASSG